MPSLCVDIDNVIAQSDFIMREVIRQFTKGRVNYSYTDIIEFEYCHCRDANGCAITNEEWLEIHEIFSQPDHLLSILPMECVQEHLAHLSTRFDIHIATTRLPQARQSTIRWLELHRIPAQNLHFLKSGKKHVALAKFAGAVEDHYEQAVAFAKSGTPCYLMRHPWNNRKPEHSDVHWVDDWNHLAELLLA